MTALEAVACYVPEQSFPIDGFAEQLGLPARQIQIFRRFYGLAEVRREPDRTHAQLLASAVEALTELRGQEHRVRYVLYARSVAMSAPYPMNPLHDLCRDFGLSHALAFTVTHHACATGLIALDVAGKLLAADGEPGALALLLAGEKTFTVDAQYVPETTFFGEAATAVLVSDDGPRDRLLSFASTIRGEFDGRLAEDADLLARYQQEFQDLLVEVLVAATDRAGMKFDELNLVLPHNVNTVTWRRLCKRLNFPLERVVLSNVPVIGHSFAADLFVNYRTAADQGLLRPGDRYLVASAGLGATFSAMVFEH